MTNRKHSLRTARLLPRIERIVLHDLAEVGRQLFIALPLDATRRKADGSELEKDPHVHSEVWEGIFVTPNLTYDRR